jgi:hypothetical protein
MRHAAGWALLLIGLLPACSRTSQRSDSSISDADLSTVEITLERTECFGRCPNYSVTISGDGLVRYEGRTFVKEVGEREVAVAPSAVRKLLVRFQEVGFFDLKDRYIQPVTDVPAEYLTLRSAGRVKTIENSYAGPAMGNPWGGTERDATVQQTLFELASAIDAAVQIEKLIGTEEERAAMREEWQKSGGK